MSYVHAPIQVIPGVSASVFLPAEMALAMLFSDGYFTINGTPVPPVYREKWQDVYNDLERALKDER